MDTLKYIVKRLLMSILILFGVSIIIYSMSRMMPTDFVDNQYLSAVNQGTMKQEDVDRIKEIYGLYMPDAFLSVKPQDGAYNGKKFTKSTKNSYYERVPGGMSYLEFYMGSFDSGKYRVKINTTPIYNEDGTTVVGYKPADYVLCEVVSEGVTVTGSGEEGENGEVQGTVELVEKEKPIEGGSYVIYEEGAKAGQITFTKTHTYVYNEEKEEYDKVACDEVTYAVAVSYRVANFWDKTGAVLGGYFTWLGNLMKGDLGMSFKYKQPVGTVIVEHMGISFAIAFVATILEFIIAIPLGIKAATNQYGVIDYTVTVLTMIGISLPTFFLGALVIRGIAMPLGWDVGGLHGILPDGASWLLIFGDELQHLILPMFVLVILSIGSLMRYTRTNTLEVLNADYIRTARAKGLSERSVIYKHAFRNTMIPLVTLLAGTIPSLFCGAMITEEVFAIPGIGQVAYQALLSADIPFIMGYNMFIAIMTILGTLLSDLLYAVVDPRVKLTK